MSDRPQIPTTRYRPPSGLIKALDDTGRVRGSSATPQPMENSSSPAKSGYDFLMNRAQSLVSGYDPSAQHSPSISGSATSVNGLYENGSLASRLSVQKKQSVRDSALGYENQLTDLIIKIGTSSLPPDVRNNWISEVRSITYEFQQHIKYIDEQVNQLIAAKTDAEHRLTDTAKNLKQAAVERDEACKESKFLRIANEELHSKAKQAATRLDELNRKHQSEISKLSNKVKAQDEQLKAKRNMGSEISSANTSTRRSVLSGAATPFDSPGSNWPPRSAGFNGSHHGFTDPPFVSNPMVGLQSGKMISLRTPDIDNKSQNSGWCSPPPKRNRDSATIIARRSGLGGLPTGKAMPAGPDLSFAALNASMHSVGITEHGEGSSESSQHASFNALTKFKGDIPNADVIATQMTAELADMFNLIEAWALKYANIPHRNSDAKIAVENPKLWDYMLNCTYPGNRADAHAHTMTLLREESCRYHFVVRMIADYMFKEVINIQAWSYFSKDTDKALADVNEKLLERGLVGANRQVLIDQRVDIILSIMESEAYDAWRSSQLLAHSKRLREMLGPILNRHSDRSSAGKELGLLAITGWNQTAKMFSMPFTFQIFFPETNSKFTAANMQARDKVNYDPMSLQVKQTRLKLVITPVITLRDDRGRAIKAKSLQHATVLTMD